MYLSDTDALADVLQAVRLTANTYFCTDFRSPWGMDIPASEHGMFHAVIDGECWLRIDGETEVRHLVAGDIVAFPTGGAHWMSDSPNPDLQQHLLGGDVVQGILSGANPFEGDDDATQGNPMTLMCGSFAFDSSVSHPLIRDLPCFIQMNSQVPALAWVNSMIQVMSRESREASPGSQVVVDRLTEILFIELLRQYMRDQQQPSGYLSALHDKSIGQALNLIHGDAEGVLTVERLAEAVNLSRSAFTERFTHLVDQSPKQYLTDWRMHKAKAALQATDESMLLIAEQAGFSSEAAFSKAFKKFFRETPGSLRRALKRHKS